MFTFASEDNVKIHVHEWQPAAAPRAVVQLAHGMGEHALRYAPLAEALTARGYAVYADDHRGHGLSIHDRPGNLGEDGWNLLVKDLVALSTIIRERHPGLPLILLGHSMGSFATQSYLLDHAELIDAAVLCGTTALDQLFTQLAEGGPDALVTLNKPFEPARTPADWISRDTAQVDAYMADPLSGFGLAPESMGLMGAAAFGRLADPQGIRTELPLYVMVGDRDPVNGGLAFSDTLVERYRNAGLTDVTYRTYPGARHELFNEINRDEVVAELIEWLERVVR
ncbi:lysophospholipase [Streptomyces sp. NPDC051218]|uniref:lysophospholipase n=1 Tax=Streptomyces sp. NPDC051218 TaxID=3365645 RepID=UPI00378A488B